MGSVLLPGWDSSLLMNLTSNVAACASAVVGGERGTAKERFVLPWWLYKIRLPVSWHWQEKKPGQPQAGKMNLSEKMRSGNCCACFRAGEQR